MDMDFKSVDFEKTQEILNAQVGIKKLNEQLNDVTHQKESIISTSLNGDENNYDVIQNHLDKYTLEELKKKLDGPIKNKKDIIDSFFTNDETGDILQPSFDTKKTDTDEYEFKRAMLLYFKQTDYYVQKIEEEQSELDKTMKELNSDISSALNPLKDNILAYASYLREDSNNQEDESLRNRMLRKAKAIEDGYDFKRIFSLLEQKPGIMKNAVLDFKKEHTLIEVGKRYNAKLKRNKIAVNLCALLTDDITESLEYKVFPIDEYKSGLEGFTVFFLIRYFSKGLEHFEEDTIFHSSVYISITRLLEGSLDEDVANTLKEAILKLLEMATPYL